MKAILIDPKHRAIMQIDYSGDYRHIYEHLSFINSFGNSHKVRAFDVVRTPTGGDGIYVDDEGLYAPAEDKHWFNTYSQQAEAAIARLDLNDKSVKEFRMKPSQCGPNRSYSFKEEVR